MGQGTYSALGRLSGFLFFSFVLFGVNVGKEHPAAILITSIFLLAFGIPLSVYGLYSVQRYKDVYDFEPTIFWKQERNGKYAREILAAVISIGIWASLAGAALIFITSGR